MGLCRKMKKIIGMNGEIVTEKADVGKVMKVITAKRKSYKISLN